MPPDPKQTPPAPPTSADPPAGGGTEDRLQAVEREQQRQGGMLEQILSHLPGNGPSGGQNGPTAPAAGGAGKSVAELVREGIADLERERAAAAEGDANRSAREDHAARLAALEERVPAETAATPVGAFRARMQRAWFGIDQPGR
jgi:hypothetical protein